MKWTFIERMFRIILECFLEKTYVISSRKLKKSSYQAHKKLL